MELKFPSFIQTQVLIVGGGVTGAALARDLALRYVAGDAGAARECRMEGDIDNALSEHMTHAKIADVRGTSILPI